MSGKKVTGKKTQKKVTVFARKKKHRKKVTNEKFYWKKSHRNKVTEKKSQKCSKKYLFFLFRIVNIWVFINVGGVFFSNIIINLKSIMVYNNNPTCIFLISKNKHKMLL